MIGLQEHLYATVLGPARVLRVEGAVKLDGAAPWDVDEQIAWKRHGEHAVGARIDAQEHHRVGALTGRGGRIAELVRFRRSVHERT